MRPLLTSQDRALLVPLYVRFVWSPRICRPHGRYHNSVRHDSYRRIAVACSEDKYNDCWIVLLTRRLSPSTANWLNGIDHPSNCNRRLNLDA
jgi:hypothetical protein